MIDTPSPAPAQFTAFGEGVANQHVANIEDFPVEKFYRDSKLCTIGEGTSEIQKIVISRSIIAG